jgi:hypothetical protein
LAKIPVNAPCPCGSGKKYKKCCRDRHAADVQLTPQEVQEVAAKIAAHLGRKAEHQRRFGHVRPSVHADWKGQKFVAVGDRLFASPHFRTPQDFLAAHLAHLFGPRLWQEEWQKPLHDAHPLVRLARLTYERIEHGEAHDGLVAPALDGTVFEFAAACYDLYVLRHNGAYQRSLLERLRRAEHYRGARYELLVAATFVRAGFDLTWINERKADSARPEFIATHRETGTRVAVEAKSRHREAAAPDLADLNVASLLADALAKQADDPLAVFVDVNIARAVAPQTQAAWEALVERELGRTTNARDTGGRAAYGVVVFTNYRHEDAQPALFQMLMRILTSPQRAIPPRVYQALDLALDQFGNIPSSFDE